MRNAMIAGRNKQKRQVLIEVSKNTAPTAGYGHSAYVDAIVNLDLQILRILLKADELDRHAGIRSVPPQHGGVEDRTDSKRTGPSPRVSRGENLAPFALGSLTALVLTLTVTRCFYPMFESRRTGESPPPHVPAARASAADTWEAKESFSPASRFPATNPQCSPNTHTPV